MKLNIESPVGNLELSFDDNSILNKINFIIETQKKILDPKIKINNLVVQQLNSYFKNPRFKFNIPLKIEGTNFQKKVWQVLMKIPAGKTITYGDLAKQLKTAPRAIGGACKANPIPIIIPCHRVVAKQGLGGYAGKRLGNFFAIKQWLLEHEQKKEESL